MRTFVILLAATAGLMGLGFAFEANATMGVLQRPAESFSPVEKADCVEQGFFCPKGSTLQCSASALNAAPLIRRSLRIGT